MTREVVVVIIAVGLLVILMGGFAALVVFMSRSFRKSTQAKPNPALEIAKERYARGEISRDDFEQIRKDLS